MAAATSNYIEAIRCLPEGGILTLNDISWKEYEQLLDDLGDGYRVRINYDGGRLIVVSPSQFHEMYSRLLSQLALIAADLTGRLFESRGSMTFKVKTYFGGAEPDACFYIQNASRISGKRNLDLGHHPPPDVIVEIDISHSSMHKFDFYSQIGAPEIWHYDEERLQIYLLTEHGYQEADASIALPALTGVELGEFLERSKTEGQTAVRNEFRKRLQEKVRQEGVG